jgi:hypothetical protein
MKLSKFVLSVLIGFVALGLVAPQQEKAVPTLGGSFTLFQGASRITPNGQVNTLDLDIGFTFIAGATGQFAPFDGMPVTFTDATMTFTGIGQNVNLIDGFSFNIQGTDSFKLMGGMDTLSFSRGSNKLVGSQLRG